MGGAEKETKRDTDTERDPESQGMKKAGIMLATDAVNTA